MPPPSFPSFPRGMTANRMKPAKRYRPGKPIADEIESSEEEDEEDEEEEEEQTKIRTQRKPVPLKPSAKDARQITSGVRQVRIEPEDEEGFITEEEDKETKQSEPASRSHIEGIRTSVPEETEKGEEESEEDESEEESISEQESSSEEEQPRKLLRPTFIKKGERKQSTGPMANSHIAAASSTNRENDEDAFLQRRAKTDLLIKEQLEKDAAARIASNKSWDDDEEGVVGVDEDHIDDQDGLDPEAEQAAWKLRELKRVKREREAIEVAEKEREEIERRRNLTAEERDKEDRDFIDKQKEERDAGRGKSGFMQRYFHKGAFFQPDLEKHGLNQRDLMGGQYVDESKHRETLPEYLQVRDTTKIGRKGRTKYKDLKAEDTGRWGVSEYYRNNASASSATRFGINDERFLPDSRDRGLGPSGANKTTVNERNRASRRHQSRSISRSPSRRPRDLSRSRSPSRRRSDRRSHSRSRSPSQRDRYRGDDRSRRKRSYSPKQAKDKRRKLDSVS